MKEFNLNRLNIKKIQLQERPLVLKQTKYNEPKINNGYLVNDNNDIVGTKGDMYTKLLIDNILEYGTLDNNPRPHYEDIYENAKYNRLNNTITTSDGNEIKLNESENVIEKEDGIIVETKAHTISINQPISCSYDLSKNESPLITLRPIAVKSSIAEILWIYQKESNDLVVFDELLNKNTWDKDKKINNWWNDWALKDENGNYILNEENHPTIGSCYGETNRKHKLLKKNVIEAIKNNPDGRRNIVSLWQEDDFLKPHGLKPCAFQTIWNVRHEWDGIDYLDMTLIQRSSDFLTAGCINQLQYCILLEIIAKELNLQAGRFTWKPTNIQIYDRHIDNAITMMNREPIDCNPSISLNSEIESFYDYKPEDIKIINYNKELIKKKNPSLKFQLGI